MDWQASRQILIMWFWRTLATLQHARRHKWGRSRLVFWTRFWLLGFRVILRWRETSQISRRWSHVPLPSSHEEVSFFRTTFATAKPKGPIENILKSKDNSNHDLCSSQELTVTNLRNRQKHYRCKGLNLYIFSTLRQDFGTVRRKTGRKSVPMWECLWGTTSQRIIH